MQPQIEYNSVNRRPLDVEDYIDIMRRHKAWIVGPLFAGLVVSTIVAFLWPDTYVSSAVLRVVPPQVPESYVPTNVNMEMSQRINAMAQQILSRGTLTNIVQTFGLFQREQSRLPMEDIIENIKKKHIRIGQVQNISQAQQPGRNVAAFQISFSYENRIAAQKVCADLVSRFMNENTRDRANQSVFTTQFLKDQWEAARKELEGIEDKLTQFRLRNAGRLPDQMQANLQQLNAMETRLAALNGNMNRMHQDKLLLESQLRIAKDQLTGLTVPEAQEQRNAAANNQRLAGLDRDILMLETQISALREQYKETHPDVQRAMGNLAILKRSRDQLMKQEEENKPAEPSGQSEKRSVNPAYIKEARELEANIKRIQGLMAAKDMELEQATKDISAGQKVLAAYQQRIEVTPVGEKEYGELLRDRDLARQRYEELNRKKTQSALATDLENRQQGETLELLDAASLPQTPTEPNRAMIVGSGAGIGLLVGLFLAGARELKDTSLKNLKDVRAYTGLTVLGSVPLLENDLVVRRRRRLNWLAWSTACLMGIVVMSASAYYYYYIAKV